MRIVRDGTCLTVPLLTQNRELRPHLIWGWSIPALTAVLADGRRISTCPSAGVCARVCYARSGTFLFSNVLAAHTRNLQRVVDDPTGWRTAMIAELGEHRFTRDRAPRRLPIATQDVHDAWLRTWIQSGKPAVRIHDSGDFFAPWYLEEWLRIAEARPHLLFYAYTKEIAMLQAANTPLNFRWLASTGGTQDHLIDDSMRHADVFPDEAHIAAAGYTSQTACDLLAVLLPTNRVGIPANNIPAFKRRMAGRTFSRMQHELHAKVAP